MDPIIPTHISQLDSRTLGITWSDGHQSRLDVVALRRQCRCASCVDEWTQAPRLDPASISDETRPVSISPVGNYAIHIEWSDGHSTGIYSFTFLRSLS